MRFLTSLALVFIMAAAVSAGPHRLNPKPKKKVYRGGPVVISELVKTRNGSMINTPSRSAQYNRRGSSFSR